MNFLKRCVDASGGYPPRTERSPNAYREWILIAVAQLTTELILSHKHPDDLAQVTAADELKEKGFALLHDAAPKGQARRATSPG